MKKDDSIRALLLQFVEAYMKMCIDQFIISIQGIYRQHLQLAEAECASFLPHPIGITRSCVTVCRICLGDEHR